MRMSFRDRITWAHEQEAQEDKVIFTIEESWTSVDCDCDGRKLANFLANIVDLASHMLEDADYPEELENKIINLWKKNLRDLTAKRKKC